jgi:hypothetical protein
MNRDKEKLEAAEMRFLRRLLDTTRLDHQRNIDIRKYMFLHLERYENQNTIGKYSVTDHKVSGNYYCLSNQYLAGRHMGN